ncbi:MAG: DUF5011 domain-containing protein [Bacteroidota bacterium]
MKSKLIIPIFIIVISILLASSCKKDEVGDGTTPEIIVLGINPLYWAVDIPYEDAGAMAFDITPEGDTIDITSRIITADNVDVSATGDYEVKYNVSDESGVNAVEKIRNVKVVVGK